MPFVIDADALTPDPDWPPAVRRACHENLLDIWQRAGLLKHDGKTFEGSRLKAAVMNLPIRERTRWQEVLQRLPLAECGNGWSGTVSQASLPDVAEMSRLALVDDTQAEAEFGLGENDSELALDHGGHPVDICRLLAASQASVFQEAIARAGTHIESGQTYQQIWDTRFRMLASAPIKTVSVVDRYAIQNHRDHPQASLSGLDRFLRLLDASASGPRHVSVYSAWTAGLGNLEIDDVAADVQPVLDRLQSGRVQRITLHMVPNTAFSNGAHDRFVRFGDHYVWDLGLGVDVFDGPAAAARSSSAFKTGLAVASYRNVESDLRGHAYTKTKALSR